MTTAQDKTTQRDIRFKREGEKEGDDRSPAQRDRDRIIYSSAFRRLAQVTQVVAPDNAHVFHSRLTHSLQVAQVGRRLAEKLIARQPDVARDVEGLNADVVEAACLAHDLGHPPFGHIAEEELNALGGLKLDGFEGNAQSFRIVTKLAFRTPDYPGLNLTRATLAAILKYPWFRGRNPHNKQKWGAYSSERGEFEFARKLIPQGKLQRTAEAELMDWADDVTYSVHDLEDFYRAGRMPLHLLAARDDKERKSFFDEVFARRKGQQGIWRECSRSELENAFTELMILNFRLSEPYSGSQDHRSRLRSFTILLIGRYINGVELCRPANPTDSRVMIDPEFRKEVAMLKELTWHYVINAPALATQQYAHRHIIRELFEIFHEAALSPKKLKMLPAFYQEKVRNALNRLEVRRIVIDLVAGMTERQAIALYQQLRGIQLGSGLEPLIE